MLYLFQWTDVDSVHNFSTVDKIFIVKIIPIILIIRMLLCTSIKENTDNTINTNNIDNIGKSTTCGLARKYKNCCEK